jgi:hypothetical protein
MQVNEQLSIIEYKNEVKSSKFCSITKVNVIAWEANMWTDNWKQIKIFLLFALWRCWNLRLIC